MQRSAIHCPTLRQRWRPRILALLALLCLPLQAQAIFIPFPPGAPPQLIIRVGSPNATINQVTFALDTQAVFLNTGSVVPGVPGNGAPGTSPANGIDLVVRARMPVGQTRLVRLTANSSQGMACVAGSGCGTQVIPFNLIRWAAANQGSFSYPGSGNFLTVQDGAFDNSGNQQLTVFGNASAGIEMNVVMFFEYRANVFYPAGRYRGRVFFTATMM